MRVNKYLSVWAILPSIMVIGTLILFLLPNHAFATDPDSDGDGFTDIQEINGIDLFVPITLSTGETVTSIGGSGSNPDLPRADRLDPYTPDLFVILATSKDLSGDPEMVSHIPDDPLLFVNLSTSEGGLGIQTHLIPYGMSIVFEHERQVSDVSPQKAIMISESLTPADGDDTKVGFATPGTPMGKDGATIWTRRIYDYIDYEACPTGIDLCIDISQQEENRQELKDLHVRNTICHEVGHILGPLAPDYIEKFGGNHYKSGTRVIMEQFPVYTKKGSKVTFYLSKEYTPVDLENLKLN